MGAIQSAFGTGTATFFQPTGLTGATAPTRYVGGTVSGAPLTGTFQVGDFIIDETGKVWICTVAGSPGTWTAVGGVTPAVLGETYVFSLNRYLP